MIICFFVLGKIFYQLGLVPLYASGTWCIPYPDAPPCHGAPGRCTVNADGSEGGFVANTAFVQNSFPFYWRNKPFIGKNAQICDSAQVLDNAKVYGFAVVEGWAIIEGQSQVFEEAKVCGNARVGGTAQVYWHCQVCGNAWLDEGEFFKGIIAESAYPIDEDEYEVNFKIRSEFDDERSDSNFLTFKNLTHEQFKEEENNWEKINEWFQTLTVHSYLHLDGL